MKYLSILLFIFLSYSISGQSGLQFIDNDLDLAFKKAHAGDKMVFLYTYTTWCGPCKVMKKDVFPDAEVGQFYNDAFVNVKVDMEKGKGFEIAQKYQVQAYPTLFFLSADGAVVHSTMGGRSVFDFLDLGNAALDPERQISTLRKRYEAGERSPSFLKQYVKAVSESEFTGFEPITLEYLETQDDWNTPENLEFLFDYSEAAYESELFQYTLKHKDAFDKVLGKEKVDSKIEFAAERDRAKAGISREDVDKMQAHFIKYFSKEKAYDIAMQTYFKQLMYSPDPVEQEMFITEIQLYLASTPEVPSKFYNAVAWQVYEITNDRDVLQKAANWAEISIAKDSNSYNNDTLAHLLYKLGKSDRAKEYALTSVELAKDEGADPSETLKLLEKL